MLTNVQPTQRRFAVVVSNAEGAVTSILATLTVLLPPGITVQPQSDLASLGQSASLNVTASGTGPFRYQWQRNGEDLPGGTNQSLSFVAAEPTNDAAYKVVVSNPYGAVTSRVATLSVLLPVDALQARTFTNAPPGPMPYRLFIPTNYTAAERYPLVMFLHGHGAEGNDNHSNLSAGLPGLRLLFTAVDPASFLRGAAMSRDACVERPCNGDAVIGFVECLGRGV